MKLYFITLILATSIIVAVQSASLIAVSMDQPRCGVTDADGKALSFGKKWEKNHITWSYRGSAPSQIGAQRTRQLLTEAFQKWADVVPLTFSEQCSTCSADIVISTDHVDGRSGGSLAVAKFQNDGSTYFDGTHVSITFDNKEPWTEKFGAASRGRINFYLVAIHEIGHTLGLDHDTDENAIMQANYYAFEKEDMIPEPDVTEMRRIYGRKSSGRTSPRKPAQTTPSPSDSDDGDSSTFNRNGMICTTWRRGNAQGYSCKSPNMPSNGDIGSIFPGRGGTPWGMPGSWMNGYRPPTFNGWGFDFKK